jgi:hypothetical protein
MKLKISFSLTLFLLLFSISVAAQVPQKDNEGEVIRISSELVLVDALVLDKQGNQVTDLSAEDFEILQDGKPQKIVNFTYVNTDKNASNAKIPTQPQSKKDKKAIPPPPVSLRSPIPGRIITFVVDDGNCLATIQGTASIRDSLRKFINEQMLSDDKVAIYRTRGGSSLLQTYTSNKEVLNRVVDKISWFPSSCGSAFEAFRDKSTIKASVGESSRGRGAESFESEADKEFREANERRDRENQVIGTIGVVGFVIDRMKNLPQRKHIFLLSEGIITDFNSRAFDSLRELADKALRSSVVVHTISAKGVTVPGMLTAQDEVLPGIVRGGTDNTGPATDARISEERQLNEGLAYLSYTTGGKFIRNRNNLDTGVKEVLDAEKGYYLIGYQPDENTFKGKNFHRIEVRLKRPDLIVSSRKGFYGRLEEENRQPKNKSAETPLYQAISSPLQETGMDIRLTTLVGSDAVEGNFIRALFHVKGEDLTFTDEPDGTKKVVLDVVVVAFDEKGKVVDEFNRTYPIGIPPQGVETIKQNGLEFSTDMPVKKPGFYSFRLAVRDNNSKRLGSAGDFVEIPDVKKGNFFISGFMTTAVTSNGKPLLPKKREAKSAFAPVFLTSIPAIRKYTADSALAYTYSIYNAKRDSSGQTKLTRQVRLYRNGELLAEGREIPIEAKALPGETRIDDEGFLRLSADLPPGEYFLQIIVRDTLAGKTASQWIDFEIVK